MPVVPFIPLIAAGVGAGTSLIGGAMGAGASKDAARMQAQSAAEAQKYINDLLNQYNPPIGQAAETGATAVTEAGAQSQQAIRDAVAQGRTDLTPYMTAGGDALTNLAQLMQPGGDLNRNFTFQDMQQLDPGYQFRMDQASKALQASAAAKGGALSGGTLQSLANLNQNLASSEYANAFDRFRAQQTDRFNRFNTLAGMGYNAASNAATLGLRGGEDLANYTLDPAKWAANQRYAATVAQANNAMGAGGSIANLITGAGAAQAAGAMGSANAWANALGGVGSAVGQAGNYYQDQATMNKLADILKNPANQLGNLPTSSLPPSMRNLYPWPK